MAKSKKVVDQIDEETGELLNAGEVNEYDAAEAKKDLLKKRFSKIKDYREKANIKEVEYKPQEWIDMSPAFKEVTRLPGIAVGHMQMVMGKSDVGKTTLLVEAGANAIMSKKSPVLPILIITEEKFSFDRAATMGLDPECCLIYAGVSTIEQGWEIVREHLEALENGTLQKEMGINDVIFLWDSIGATPSKAELENSDENYKILKKMREEEVKGGKIPKDSTKHGGMMVTAKVLREKFTRDLVHKINKTRHASCPYNATMLIVNHAYTAPPKAPATISTLEPYGGDAIWLASSLVFRMGGISSRSSNVTAVKDGFEVSFAIKSALVVAKNHITNVKASGKIICTDFGFIEDSPSSIENYKKKYKNEWNLQYDKYWNSVSED